MTMRSSGYSTGDILKVIQNEIMKKTLLILSIVSVNLLCFSQSVVLSKNVDEQYTGNHGPNMRHYGYLYSGIGLVVNTPADDTPVRILGSEEYTTGYRYKLKLLSFYALGLDVSYIHTRYSYDLDALDRFNPSNPLTFEDHEKRHVLVNNSITLEVYQRINIGKRGNILGNYIDLGIAGSWNHTVKEIIVKSYDDNQYLGSSRRVNRGLDIHEPFSYGLTARIGRNKFAIYGKYRLSDYFNNTYNIPEIPRLRIGLELGV